MLVNLVKHGVFTLHCRRDTTLLSVILYLGVSGKKEQKGGEEEVDEEELKKSTEAGGEEDERIRTITAYDREKKERKK